MTSLLTRNTVGGAVSLFVTCMLLVGLIASPGDPLLARYAAVSAVLAALAWIGFRAWSDDAGIRQLLQDTPAPGRARLGSGDASQRA